MKYNSLTQTEYLATLEGTQAILPSITGHDKSGRVYYLIAEKVGEIKVDGMLFHVLQDGTAEYKLT